MAKLKLVLGNKNYSSWSMRAWLVLKHLGVAFDEVVIPLDQPSTREEILKYSPSGRVPALHNGDLVVSDSLAICEYLNELYPDRQLWPADPAARAIARSVSAEMHAGFQAMRNELPMKFRESLPGRAISAEVKQDIARIMTLWADCRRRFGSGGPFLFGAYCIADAMYTPVVSRFKTYGVRLDGVQAAYAETIWSLPSVQEWLGAARAEPYRMERYETAPV
ncbi:MAG TPA: glutathione S-transferase family protein [Myxococcaceae bacterium]|nr:glutathione S-transferase family protein [Myxococcaceae bacterium]